jgi:hypothetical protein
MLPKIIQWLQTMFEDEAKMLTSASARDFVQVLIASTLRVPKGNFIMGFNEVLTNVGILLSFLRTIRASILMRISHFFIINFIFNTNHGPIYYARTFILG